MNVHTGRADVADRPPAGIVLPVPGPTRAATPSLLYWRMQRGWIQRQLAERSGVDRATVQRLEAGGLARMDTVSKLAAALGVEPADLMRQPPEA